MENAQNVSPEHTQVRVGVSLGAGGLVVEIDDRGLGMDAEHLHDANILLSEPTDLSRLDSTRLGLVTAGRLARRHGIGVVLRDSPYGGVTAIVRLPADLLQEATADGPDIVPMAVHRFGPPIPGQDRSTPHERITQASSTAASGTVAAHGRAEADVHRVRPAARTVAPGNGVAEGAPEPPPAHPRHRPQHPFRRVSPTGPTASSPCPDRNRSSPPRTRTRTRTTAITRVLRVRTAPATTRVPTSRRTGQRHHPAPGHRTVTGLWIRRPWMACPGVYDGPASPRSYAMAPGRARCRSTGAAPPRTRLPAPVPTIRGETPVTSTKCTSRPGLVTTTTASAPRRPAVPSGCARS
ncbi:MULTISPECIES: ATP-binding protein [Streptomyces]|uniref:ATP-binding protein n=1 Tax=Streptomyces TaxID=1883 RepID=UPI0033B832C3